MLSFVLAKSNLTLAQDQALFYKIKKHYGDRLKLRVKDMY